MKWIKGYKLYKESKKSGSSRAITDLCIGMLLINPSFLDNILDRGLKARYTENSNVFLNDLKNLLMANNRLKLGKFVDGKCVIDNETSKITQELSGYESDFDIEEDWNKLISARNLARGIQDKLLEERLESDRIRYVYWVSPNKDKENVEDLVLELNDGNQYSIMLNSKLSLNKTISFNTFGDILIDNNIEKLFDKNYLPKWDKLVQEWIRIIYENANNEIKLHIEKFIDPDRIYSIQYFDYFNIRHRDKNYQHLGELIPQFNKNVLKFSDLMTLIYKNADTSFDNPEEVKKEWNEKKIFILNSRILEHLFTESFEKLIDEDSLNKDDDGYIISDGDLKTRLMKLILELLKVTEKYTYYISNNGNKFHVLPSRTFFRDNFDRFNIKYDYHVELTPSEDEELNESNFIIKLDFNDEPLMTMNLMTGFTGGAMNSSLSTKIKVDLDDRFNQKLTDTNA